MRMLAMNTVGLTKCALGYYFYPEQHCLLLLVCIQHTYRVIVSILKI